MKKTSFRDDPNSQWAFTMYERVEDIACHLTSIIVCVLDAGYSCISMTPHNFMTMPGPFMIYVSFELHWAICELKRKILRYESRGI